VTLVIDPRAEGIQTYVTLLSVSTLEEAVEQLGVREKIAPPRRSEWVGLQTRDRPDRNRGDTGSGVRESIADWLGGQPLDAVVWTALPARGPSGDFERPELDVLLTHLESLTGSARARAEEYIRRAPQTVRTPYRRRFEEVFGWEAEIRDPLARADG
jgi:hypothetical protein